MSESGHRSCKCGAVYRRADEVGDPVTTLTNDALVPVFATKVRVSVVVPVLPMSS
jgi:hypothetical protein